MSDDLQTASEADVFISYASPDASIASSIVTALEQNGLQCWIAPRDVVPGSLYADGIVRAINGTQVLVLVLSEHAIASAHVGKEIERASSKRHPIFVVRTDAAPLTPAFEYFLSESQWIDVNAGGVKAAVTKLPEAVRRHLEHSHAAEPRIRSDRPITSRATTAPRTTRPMWVVAVVSVSLVLGYFAVDKYWPSKHGVAEQPAVAVAPTDVSSATAISAPAPERTAILSIAVLPFVAMSEDASLRHLGQGLCEEITNELTGRSELHVVSRTSAFETQDVVAIAHALGVSYVLEGSVRPSGDKVRVTAQLVRGQDGLNVLSDTYDVAEADSAAWNQAAASIAVNAYSYMALERELQSARTFTGNAQAYEHYAVARRLSWQLGNGGTAIAKPSDQILGEIDRAIALDPEFLSAHLSRGWLFLQKLELGAACGSRCIDEARRSVNRALTLRPDDPEALLLLASIQLTDELDPTAAQVTLERVREIDPTNRYLNQSFAFLAMFRGDVKSARDYWVRQLEVTPYFAAAHAYYGLVLASIGDLDGADREFRSALRLTQRGEAFGLAGLHIHLLLARGRIDEAKAEFAPLWAQYRYTQPERLVRELASLGYEREAREYTAKLSQQSDVDPFWVFQAYWGLGRYDDALIWLRRVIDGRDARGLFALRMPNSFSGLDEQPGYADLQKYLDSIQRSR